MYVFSLFSVSLLLHLQKRPVEFLNKKPSKVSERMRGLSVTNAANPTGS